METQFGIAHVWQQGDGITRTVACVLLLMSVLSWAVIVLKVLNLRRQQAHMKTGTAFWQVRDFADALQQLGAPDNPLRRLAEEGQAATLHMVQVAGEAPVAVRDAVDVSEWVTRALRHAIDDYTAELQSGLSVLATVGSTAPFVGLFGTVWGIYHALLGIGASGQASIDKVAGPIGEALIMTALGLVVAIPAVLGYNLLVRGNKGVLHKLNRFAHDLHAYFVTGARVVTSKHPA